MSFNIRDIDPEYVRAFGGHYNRIWHTHVSQAEMRAKHDEPGHGGQRS